MRVGRGQGSGHVCVAPHRDTGEVVCYNSPYTPIHAGQGGFSPQQSKKGGIHILSLFGHHFVCRLPLYLPADRALTTAWMSRSWKPPLLAAMPVTSAGSLPLPVLQPAHSTSTEDLMLDETRRLVAEASHLVLPERWTRCQQPFIQTSLCLGPYLARSRVADPARQSARLPPRSPPRHQQRDPRCSRCSQPCTGTQQGVVTRTTV